MARILALKAGILIGFSVLITSCGMVKNLFPDKEKDYQFAQEIQLLQIPDDLQNASPQLTTNNNDALSPLRPASKSRLLPVKLMQYDGGASRLRIAEPFYNAWRYVGKALSRHSIEILERSEAKQLYRVNYDPEGKKLTDNSWWDELVFIFGDDPNKETQLKILLSEQQANQTEVIVLDRHDEPVSEGVGLQLLELLKKTINEDLADNPKASTDLTIKTTKEEAE